MNGQDFTLYTGRTFSLFTLYWDQIFTIYALLGADFHYLRFTWRRFLLFTLYWEEEQQVAKKPPVGK